MTTKHFIRGAMLAACCLLVISAGVYARDGFTISEKLQQTFHRTFPDASQVKWIEEPNVYQVTFWQNGMLTKVEYDKDARFISSMRYYSAKNLPVTIMYQLQKNYPGKEVWGVTEVSTQTDTEYYVKLVDDHHWYTVHSDANGAMETIEKYKKI